MSDERDRVPTGFVDRGPAAVPEQAGATAAADQREVPPGQEPAADQQPLTEAPAGGRPAGPPVAEPEAAEPATGRPAPPPAAPVQVHGRPRPRVPNRDQMMRMGPWAPVAGAALGLLLGVVVVLLLAPEVETFDQRLALVFVVLGLTLLGAGGTLLADEVRMLRRGAQAAEVRASNVGAIAGLLNGLTPARLLIIASAFVLLLSAYVTSGG
jgi:hypothetical protein